MAIFCAVGSGPTEVVINFDGHGLAAIKKSGYNEFVQKQPIQYGGFKMFYKKDGPLMTPKDVLEMDPASGFVNYQEPGGQVPWLHLAIDTEFHVKEGQIPRVDLGTDNGKEVQEAIEYY
ncbi:hypothetical protein SFC50_04500 [Bacillus infantis]|uniref:hypothetical protein n=1 Tax=Bacillus infantis TaxID=324767 RepID=UPI003981F8FA